MVYLLRWPGAWIMPYGNPLQPHVPLILDAQFPKNCFVVGEIGHLYSKKHFLMLWQGEEQGTSVLRTDKNSPGETEEADVSFSLLPVGASISPLNTMQLDWNVRERSNCEEGEKETLHKYSVFHQQLHKEISYKSEKNHSLTMWLPPGEPELCCQTQPCRWTQAPTAPSQDQICTHLPTATYTRQNIGTRNWINVFCFGLAL